MPLPSRFVSRLSMEWLSRDIPTAARYHNKVLGELGLQDQMARLAIREMIMR